MAALAVIAAFGLPARAEEKHEFEHVHALAMNADGRTLFLGAHTMHSVT